jgi:hypothetical protein
VSRSSAGDNQCHGVRGRRVARCSTGVGDAMAGRHPRAVRGIARRVFLRAATWGASVRSRANECTSEPAVHDLDPGLVVGVLGAHGAGVASGLGREHRTCSRNTNCYRVRVPKTACASSILAEGTPLYHAKTALSSQLQPLWGSSPRFALDRSYRPCRAPPSVARKPSRTRFEVRALRRSPRSPS